ncbi:excalibur calcium-binding domain-containing protein [Lysinibacillus sp. FSL R7-0073]|uniref:excalibur calcium-binding domain-containing protein n=1 Tax=Lysinibacillus sp. FSL R7-0073 TaxID=2921669 RepID=UPI0030FC824B
MIVLDFIGVLAFLFSIGYLLYFLLKKIRKKEGLFSKKLFFSTFLGSFILLAISMQFDTVSGTEYNKQVKLNKELQSQVDTLNGKLANLKAEIAQVSKESQNIKDAESKTIEKFQTDKKILQEEQSTLKAQIATLKEENEDLSTKLASAQKVSQTTASSNQSSANNTQSAPPASTPQNIYYKNCTQVRSAGAAPIRKGDPGYARHLDRDGDGIGCE